MAEEKEPRTIEEVNQDYANTCMLLGNILYQEHIFPKKKEELLFSLESLNQEAADLKEKTDAQQN